RVTKLPRARRTLRAGARARARQPLRDPSRGLVARRLAAASTTARSRDRARHPAPQRRSVAGVLDLPEASWPGGVSRCAWGPREARSIGLRPRLQSEGGEEAV